MDLLAAWKRIRLPVAAVLLATAALALGRSLRQLEALDASIAGERPAGVARPA